MMKNIDISTFEEKGIIKVQNFLQPNELNRIKGIVKYYSFQKIILKVYSPQKI